MQIEYIDGARLRRAVIAGCDFVQRQRAELNRINVFPVPDGDTGTNLALTTAAIADHLRTVDSEDLSVVAREAAESAVMGARGNCGMILSHFLLGFAEHVRGTDRLDPAGFAAAMHAAVAHVYRSLERPVEGTIITVMREMSESADQADVRTFPDLLEIVLDRGRTALERTPDLLPALKKAGVVDAGAKGFLHLFEGVADDLNGDSFRKREYTTFDSAADTQAAGDPGTESAAAEADYPSANEKYRFCTEALVRGADLPDADAVRAMMRDRGDSLIVIRTSDLLKIHIHTDDPDDIFTALRALGTLVTHKAEDMTVQHAALESRSGSHVKLARRPISIVTDSACDLPDEVVRAHGIRVVPMQLIFDAGVLLDRVDISATQFVDRLRNGEHPTTSQPTPRAFLDAFQAAAEDGETVLAVVLGSTLSGTLASAQAAARLALDTPVRIIDSLGASLTEGMLVLLASELAEMGASPESIEQEVARVRRQSGIIFTVDVFDNLLASGRVGRGRVLIAGLLDIKPILGLDASGQVVPISKVRGKANVTARMIQTVVGRVPVGAKKLRFGVVHVGCPDIARTVASELQERYRAADVLVSPATPVIATHIGPGAWGIAWQVED
ncbi:MAG TPA: DegV family protein [Longimicrobiales bacterium]